MYIYISLYLYVSIYTDIYAYTQISCVLIHTLHIHLQTYAHRFESNADLHTHIHTHTHRFRVKSCARRAYCWMIWRVENQLFMNSSFWTQILAVKYPDLFGNCSSIAGG